MDSEETAKLKRFRKWAIRYAKSKGHGNISEDFAQEFILMVWQKKNSQNIDQCFIDFIRKEYGRDDGKNSNGALKAKAYSTMISYHLTWDS